MVVLCLLPFVLLALVLTSAVAISPWLVLGALLLCFAVMLFVAHEPDRDEQAGDPTGLGEGGGPDRGVPEDLILRTVDIIYPLAQYRLKDHYIIEGPLLLKPDAAYAELRPRFEDSALVPLLQESDMAHPRLVLAPAEALPAPAGRQSRAWLNLFLVLATLATTTWAGAAHQGVDLLAEPDRFAAGLPYALALLLILGAHELGHYFTARHHGIAVSLPYFIPVPFALGTFGAFIKMKSLAADRRQMFDVAVAGPLAGLVLAIPALLIGLQDSTVVTGPGAPGMMMGGADVGSSVLFAFLAKAALGEAVLEGHRLVLHPVAFAGWLGLLVTALNLVPVGQLDGGHLVHALLGHRTARTVGVFALGALVVLGLFVWSGLLFWALLIYLIAGTTDVPPLNDVSRVGRGRMALGAATFALLLLILLPVPHALYEAFGIHSPYL
jgi:Zn-dependent protease